MAGPAPDWGPLVSAVASCAIGFVVAARDPAASAAHLAVLAEHRLDVLAAAQEQVGLVTSVEPAVRQDARRWLQSASGHVDPARVAQDVGPLSP